MQDSHQGSEVSHIVALSGGKDSTAMALRLRELHPEIDFTYISTPTGNELPELFEHLKRLEEMLGVAIKRISPYDNDIYDDGLLAVIEEEGMIPNFRARFCTRKLKIEPTIRFLREADDPLENCDRDMLCRVCSL